MTDAERDTEYELTEPHADAMIQSLRAFGYDLATAIADLIDNSISAGAQNIGLEFFWNGGQSTFALMDDGRGMNEAQIQNAMRPGSRSPLEERDPQDLGRFGLGLKTASFSQAKRLTVGTKQDGKISIRCWDLDYVSAAKQWRLLKRGSDVFQQYATPFLDQVSTGTVVFWERLDRLVPETVDVGNERVQAAFYDRAEKIRAHLAMVFHRFLKPEFPGQKPLRIRVGRQEVRAWDPFLTNEPSTRLLAEENLQVFGDTFTVRPYVLPHHSKITREVHDLAAGPKGWNAQQGFYVYRNRRLLVSGSWLGLKDLRQEEHYKLARIMIDIPNSMDAGWGLDVKKSRAFPPAAIRDQLTALATKTRSEGARAYRFRGARVQLRAKRELTFVWDTRTKRGKITYHVNREHPVVRAALDAGGEPVDVLLRFVEETVPVPTILQHGMENPAAQSDPFENDARGELLKELRVTYQRLITIGESPEEARQVLAHMDPFYRFPEFIALLEKEDHQ